MVVTVALFWYDWQWAAVAFATTPVFVVTARLIRRPMRRAARRQRETVERISGHVQERFSMIREVQSFTAEPREERHVLDDTTEQPQELHKDAQHYTGPFELPEPTEEDLASLRAIVERAG